ASAGSLASARNRLCALITWAHAVFGSNSRRSVRGSELPDRAGALARSGQTGIPAQPPRLVSDSPATTIHPRIQASLSMVGILVAALPVSSDPKISRISRSAAIVGIDAMLDNQGERVRDGSGGFSG